MHFLIVHITYVFMGQASRNKFALLKKTKIFWLVPYNAVIKNAIIVEKKNPLGFVCKTENIDFHFLIFWNTLPKPAFCVNSLYISMQICRKGQSHPCLFLNGKKSMPPSADRGQRNIPSWKKPAPRLPVRWYCLESRPAGADPRQAARTGAIKKRTGKLLCLSALNVPR